MASHVSEGILRCGRYGRNWFRCRSYWIPQIQWKTTELPYRQGTLKIPVKLINGVTIEFSLNVFTDDSVTKILYFKKIIHTCHPLCKRLGCYHSARKTQVTERIFKLIPIHASVIYHIHWICWIHWISDSFRENSTESIEIKGSLMSLFPCNVLPVQFHFMEIISLIFWEKLECLPE